MHLSRPVRNQRGPGDAPNLLLENTKFNLNVNIGRPVFRKDEHEKRKTTERWNPVERAVPSFFLVLQRVRIFPKRCFFLSFFPFELRSRRASWSSNRISARKFFIEINDKSSMGWICEGEIIRPFFSLSPPPSSAFFPGRFLENGKTELMATDLRGFFVDPGVKLLNSIGGGSPGRFIVASKRITNVDADETARK